MKCSHFDELYHYGIIGQKWGVRRFENKDGTLTPAGKERYYGKENYKEYREERKSLVKEARNNYTSSIKNKVPEYVAKRNYKKEIKRIDESLKEKYPDAAKRREMAIKIAKGVGTAAIVGAVAYCAVDLYSYVKATDVQFDVLGKYSDGEHRAASIIADAMDLDINELSDRDEVVTAGTVLQRVIRDYGDTDKAMTMEKAKDFIYATFEENDNSIYRTLFNARGEGKKIASSREVLSDLVMPSAFKRATAFKELLKDAQFRKALRNDLRISGRYINPDNLTPGQLYNYFNEIAGSSRSISAPIYFKKISEMGYNAIRDDNDSGYLSKTPIILLNASKDTVISGKKVIGGFSEMMSRLKLDRVPEYEKKSIFK